MDQIRRRSWINFAIAIVVIVIFTIYRFANGSKEASNVIGVDDEKIGITLENGEALFIQLQDVENVEYVEDLDTINTEYTMIGDESQGAYIYIDTDNEDYVINGSSKAMTWQTYKDIMEKI